MPVKHPPRPYRSPSRDAAAEATRSRIISAACTLLAGGSKGPFSLEAVARKARVTRLTVYNHFDSKRGLLEAVFDDLAQRGGLFELAAVFSHADPDQALRLLVSVFCRFWAMHRTMLPNFRAAILADEQIAASLKQRAERRRQALAALVDRMIPEGGQRRADLVDVLFALTAFEMFEALCVRDRSAAAVQALIQAAVESAVARYRASR
jgi:AcrR family transcriptional regulator